MFSTTESTKAEQVVEGFSTFLTAPPHVVVIPSIQSLHCNFVTIVSTLRNPNIDI